MAKALDCDLEVSEFELQSWCYVYFRSYAFNIKFGKLSKSTLNCVTELGLKLDKLYVAQQKGFMRPEVWERHLIEAGVSPHQLGLNPKFADEKLTRESL